jgi:hypothetical protein
MSALQDSSVFDIQSSAQYRRASYNGSNLHTPTLEQDH